MANELGLLPVNFKNDPGKLFVGDPIMKIKVLDDTGWTEFKKIGYAAIEKTFTIENEYAEYKAGIPERTIAKAVISAKQSFECKLNQLQAETIALLIQGIVETKSDYSRVFIGSQLPTAINIAIVLQGNTQDGKALDLYIRKAAMSTESIAVGLGGKEFGSLDFKADVLVDDDPLGHNFDWPVLGEIATTATITASDDDITVASATGISEGMLVFGAGIPESVTVKSIASSVVTLSSNATTSGSLVPVKFVTEENLLKSDAAFFAFEV